MFLSVSSTFFVPVLFLIKSGMFLKPTRLDGLLGSSLSQLSKLTADKDISFFSGHIHFLISFMLLLMTINFFGTLPLLDCLVVHHVVVMSLAFPLWFVTVSCKFPPNFYYYLTNLYGSDFHLALCALIVIVELISILIRPFTLCVRLFMNVLFGQFLLSTVSTKMVYWMMVNPWTSSFGMKLVVFGPMFFILTVAELGVLLFQTMIFIMLIVSYVDDGVVSK
nr:ATP synthase F0 subunit 6 [Pholas orientalis]